MPSTRDLESTITQLLHKQHLLSASEVGDHLAQSGKTYNKTSIYRALERLLDKGLLCKHFDADGQATYEMREDHHAHITCEQCGKVTVAPCQYQHPDSLAGFVIDHHHLTLFGVCSNCQS